MFEVRYGLERRQHVLQSEWLRAFFLFMAAYNVTFWGVSISHTICNSDADNGMVVGQQVWSLVKPPMRTAIAFYRVLSACIYFTLALPQKHFHSRPRQDSCLATFRSRMLNISNIVSKVASAEVTATGRGRFLKRRVTEQTVSCVRRSGTIRYSYQTLTFGQLRLVDNLLICSFPGIVVIFLPPFLYGVMIRTAGSHQPSPNKYLVELIVSWITLGLAFFCLVIVPDYSLKRSGHHVSLVEKRTLSWLLNAEALTLLVFSCGSVLFYVVSGVFFIIYTDDVDSPRGEAASAFVSSLSCLSQLVFILLVKFRKSVHQALARRYSNWLGSALALQFAASLSALILSIQKEEFDPIVHEWKTLLGLMPLVVDFRVHVVILLYSMLVDFVEHRYRKDVDLDMLPFPSTLRSNPRCGMPGCDSSASYRLGRCNRVGCGRGYCAVCFDGILSQVGSCICELDGEGETIFLSEDEDL